MSDKLFLKEPPEKLGISSKNIENLLDDFEKYGLYIHGFLIMRHGKVAAEGYYKPFEQDELHRAYSISKTFTGTAIGLLCDEGKISLDDKVYTYFEDKCPAEMHEYIKNATIRDLLMMSTPFSSGCTYNGLKPDKDWVWTFFNAKPDHPAGTIFQYDTSGTHVLCAIVERVTGMPYLEYLKNKVLREIGFSEDAWCIKAPEGSSWGGSGVVCSMRDLARLGLLYLNKGKINGKQYLSEEYVKAATSKQIDNNTLGHERRYRYGYGYKVWITRDKSFSFMGMGDQEVICVPEKDFMFVCHADNQGNGMSESIIYELLWKHIVDNMTDDELEQNDKDYRSLQKKTSELELHVPLGNAHSSKENELDGANYKLNENPMGISSVKLEFLPDYGKFCYVTPRGEKEIKFGYGKYYQSTFPETHYSGDTIGIPANREYRCVAAGYWTQEDKLNIKVNIIDDYLGNLNITLGFKDDEIGIYMFRSAEWFLNEYSGFAGGAKDNG